MDADGLSSGTRRDPEAHLWDLAKRRGERTLLSQDAEGEEDGVRLVPLWRWPLSPAAQ